jgi:enolase
MKIIKVAGREIFDSRGEPTIECVLVLENGVEVCASVPSGISRGQHEAAELRDGGSRVMGLGVQKAIEQLETIIAPELLGREPHLIEFDLKMLDMDGTENKSRLGANTMLAVSTAVAKAQALVEELEPYEFIALLCNLESVSLPFPMFNIINGGLHANNNLPIQEFLVMPVGTANFRAALEVTTELFHTLKKLLHENQRSTAVGDEGGFASQFYDVEEVFDFIMAAIDTVCTPREDVGFVLALDVAASRLYDSKMKIYTLGTKTFSTDELICWYESLANQYPIYSIEDGLSERDWKGWAKMTKKLSEKLQIVGDDIFATSADRILKGMEDGIANATIIKPNQIGTITETLQAIKLCKEQRMNIIVSHRSGETNDTFIADLAVGTSSGQIKAGGCMRGERMAKYNRLLQIEDQLVFSLMDVD